MAEATIKVLVDRPVGTIHRNIYGHFAEHLGRCIYEGVWVGEDSPIPNTHGIRNDVVQALRKIHPPVIRWPGGCFADDYHWRDGIGPRESRPRRINAHWGQVIETNVFGTHEFIAFCRLVGAEPYLCGNVGSGTPREMRDWVEYCNFPGDSTLARERAANGSPEPFRVRYWGVGNENWGCGGHFCPEDYAAEYKRFATFLFDFLPDAPLYLIACGPNGNDILWTHRFFEKLMRGRGFRRIHGYAAHYYCGTAGTATEYTVQQWYELLWKAARMEELVVQQRAILDGYDPHRRIGLIVDEWGTWHPPTPGENPRFLWQQNTLRDALVAALTLDIFNRHADKVVMANIAQTINVLQAMILTQEEKMIVTPTYHVYAMYVPHQDGQALFTDFEADPIALQVGGRDQELFGLAGSASLKGDRLFLTVVNPSVDHPQEATIRIVGASARGERAQVLSHEDIHAHNTFDAPETVQPVESALSGEGSEIAYTFPPASVTALSFRLT
ncbi:MAG: alpha-N-arabinofuranosidase [Candidatus Poribacteria bacterium]|nr:MAG: alpha-N-arabinofuranosidase [Candidatus Poribacteria bacterium]